MQAEDVLDFLRSNPDFALQNAAILNWAHPKNQVIIPFAERQIQQLRDQRAALQSQLTQLQQQARENSVLLGNIHQLTLSLLAEDSTEALVDTALSCFSRYFSLDRVLIRLWGEAGEIPASLQGHAGFKKVAAKLRPPCCGPYAASCILESLPAQPVLQSFAQLALHHPDGDVFGILVIASDDAYRFTPELETDYLQHIGEILSQALWRSLSK
ncbi:DUF484 family protein [Craterilacuibacter sp.]|uniref:DUF484 family protein n=1 Tax=Craterilacuibacter sp. TaxID=2870909 RepID=UPI003F3AFDD9